MQVVDYEATDDMFLAKILVSEGTENVAVGQPMMVVCDDEESLPALKEFKLDESHAVAAPEPKSPEEIPPTKEAVPVDPATLTPVAPADFLVTSQTTQKTTPGPAIPASPVAVAAPVAAAPKAVAAAAPVASAFAEKWGFGAKKSAISASLLKKQQAYLDLYGLTGTTPIAAEKK